MAEVHPGVDELMELVGAGTLGEVDPLTSTDRPASQSSNVDGSSVARTSAHVRDCVACKIKAARLRDSAGLPAPTDEGLGRILAGATSLSEHQRIAISGLGGSATGGPNPGELWRVGRDRAQLVWVRKVIGDHLVSVIPVVLDQEMADDSSLLISDVESPIAVGLAAIVSLHTRIHPDAFINRVGNLGIDDDVETLVRGEGATRRLVGAPIVNKYDQRIEYQQALGDLFTDLAPSAWIAGMTRSERRDELTKAEGRFASDGLTPYEESVASHAQVGEANSEATRAWIEELSAFEEDLAFRLSARWHPTVNLRCLTKAGAFTALSKCSYLDTAVLVIVFESAMAGSAQPSELVEGAMPLLQVDVDVDAVAICDPTSEWMTTLLTRAGMRPAQSASGQTVGPHIALDGLGLVDALHKHFERSYLAWDAVDQVSRSGAEPSISSIASAIARSSLESLHLQGGRAHQPKRAVWTAVSDDTATLAEEFVRIASDGDVERALRLLEEKQNK